MASDDLATALAAERAIVRRGVERARAIEGGWVLGHPPLPDIWHLNRVHLTDGSVLGGAGGSVGDLESLEAVVAQELCGVGHERVTLDDTAAADALWPLLESRGWRRERSVVMARNRTASVMDGGSGHDEARPDTRAIAAAELAAFQPRAFAEDAAVAAISAELPASLALAQQALRAGTAWRAFGTGSCTAVLPASTATLYLDPDVGGRRVAFIDQVATLRPHREQGLARAVMHRCLREASEWQADLVALFADADDWPQVFYAGLGFDTVGRQTAFHRDR